MNTDVLSYCIDLANYLNFTKVAEKNHLTQQALSQQIINLEHQLDVRLFERNNRSVTLTPSGEAFIAEAKESLYHIDEAVKKAKLFAHGNFGTISIGYNGPSAYNNFLTSAKQFTSLYPDVELNLTHSTYVNIVEYFKEGKFDVIAVGDFEQFDESIYKIIRREGGDIKAVVSSTHPYASKKTVKPQELLDDTLICLDFSDCAPAFLKSMERYRSICGRLPSRLKMVADSDTVNLLVQIGLGYTFLQSSLRESYEKRGLVFLDIEGVSEKMPWLVLWRKDNTNPSLHLFLDLLKSSAAKPPFNV